MKRRDFLLGLLGGGVALRSPFAWGLMATGEAANAPRLSITQSAIFRAWMVEIVRQQLAQGPSPRWVHRDCAGLVRFAVHEAFKVHDAKWRRANGLQGRALPPQLEIPPLQRALANQWVNIDGKKSAFVTALALVQRNSEFMGKSLNIAQPGDVLFFDQGDEQHLMVWMGSYIAYHTGNVSQTDTGLRSVTLQQLQQWKDTRWHPHAYNPNFIGVFRLAFLAR